MQRLSLSETYWLDAVTVLSTASCVCRKPTSGNIGDEDRREQVATRWRRGAQSPDG